MIAPGAVCGSSWWFKTYARVGVQIYNKGIVLSYSFHHSNHHTLVTIQKEFLLAEFSEGSEVSSILIAMASSTAAGAVKATVSHGTLASREYRWWLVWNWWSQLMRRWWNGIIGCMQDLSWNLKDDEWNRRLLVVKLLAPEAENNCASSRRNFGVVNVYRIGSTAALIGTTNTTTHMDTSSALITCVFKLILLYLLY